MRLADRQTLAIMIPDWPACAGDSRLNIIMNNLRSLELFRRAAEHVWRDLSLKHPQVCKPTNVVSPNTGCKL